MYAVRDQSLRVLYIGQTRNPNGVIGRLAQHLSSDTDYNTFRRRVLAVLKLDEIDFRDIELLGVPFPDEPKYQETARDYREAVESLVHDNVLSILTSQSSTRHYGLVSRAQRNPYRKETEVQALAKRIGDEICSWLLAERKF